MKPPVIAIYPGTFDPITLGHEDLILRARRLFDEVVVAVAIAHHKKTLFSLDERLALVETAIAGQPGLRVQPFEGLVTHCAQRCGARVMLRGLRSSTDFDYEHQLADMNRRMAPDVETVFLAPDHRWQSISSTLVREITLLGADDAQQFVSPQVWQALQARKAERAAG